MPRYAAISCVSLAIAANASAQLGTPIGTPIDVEAYLNQTGCLGVVYAWGHLWVSARNFTPGAPHLIGKFTVDGVGLQIFNQSLVQSPIGPSASPWGGRDGAADEAANLLYFGHEVGRLIAYPYNPATGQLGSGTIITVPGLSGFTIRALARRPANGHFFTADFTSAIYEFVLDPTPTVVGTYANTANGGAAYNFFGFAWDPVNDSLWGWAIDGPEPNRSVTAVEFSSSMIPTGRKFLGSVHPPGYPTMSQNAAGGADIACDLPFNPGRLTFIGLHQTLSDSVLFYDLAEPCETPCYANCDGSTNAPVLNVNDFICFQAAFAAGDSYANCDNSTQQPVLNVNDFICFQAAFVAGCTAS